MYNKITIIGRLGADPEPRGSEERPVASLRVATTEKWRDGSGDQKELTQWHRVALFGHTASIANKILKKGDLVLIEGTLRENKWTTDAGEERTSWEIFGRQMRLLSSTTHRRTEEISDSKDTSGEDTLNDEIPF